MKWLGRLERKIGFFAIPNLMLLMVLTMVTVYAMNLLTPQLSLAHFMLLDFRLVMQGEVWRVLSFLFVPPTSGSFFIVLTLYFYYWIGSTLERHWGTFKFNVYYFIGTVGMIVAAVISGVSSNTYLNASLLFPFAMLHPDFKVMLFFVLPVKMKTVAYILLAFFGYSLLVEPLSVKLQILFSVLNFLLFFGKDFYHDIKRRQHQNKFRNHFH